ncbi:GGDEF domain-containing protein [Dactylosporangium sp. NPDC005555]|uniref:GGDEF domain-containing protein n=1 Tax=Dactylosporangium sp. NPDC005555 TaxID=3154889 RepID=UPI0033A88618
MHTRRWVLLAAGAAGIAASSVTGGRLQHVIWLLTAIACASPLFVPAGGTAARIGGDEFAVLLPGSDAAAAGVVARAFLDLLDVPVLIDGHPLRVRASVGVVDGDPKAAETLLRRADARMYEVKRERQMSSSS